MESPDSHGSSRTVNDPTVVDDAVKGCEDFEAEKVSRNVVSPLRCLTESDISPILDDLLPVQIR